MKNVGPIRHCEPPHAHSPDVASGTVARCLCIDVHDTDNDNDDNDNAWQRGPLWPNYYYSVLNILCLGHATGTGNSLVQNRPSRSTQHAWNELTYAYLTYIQVSRIVGVRHHTSRVFRQRRRVPTAAEHCRSPPIHRQHGPTLSRAQHSALRHRWRQSGRSMQLCDRMHRELLFTPAISVVQQARPKFAAKRAVLRKICRSK